MTNDLTEPQAEPLTPNEQDSLRQAAEDAIFAGMAPTSAEMRLSDQYQALQQHDDLTESVLAHKDAYRARELGPTNLTSQQAAALIAEGRHMQSHAQAQYNFAQRMRDQQLRRAQDRAFVAEIIQRVNGTSVSQAPEATSLEPSLPPTTVGQASETQDFTPNSQHTHGMSVSENETQNLEPRLQHNPTALAPEDEVPQGSLDANSQLASSAPSAQAPEHSAQVEGLDASLPPVDSAPAPQTPKTQDFAPSLPHADSTSAAPAPEDAEPQGGLGPNFQRAKRDALLGLAPSARRTNPVLSLLSTPAPGTSTLHNTAMTSNEGSAPSAASLATAANATDVQSAASTDTQAATPAQSTASLEADGAAPAPSNLLPPDFASQALDFETCCRLVAPVLAQVRADQDEVLGQRYAHLREASYSFYQLEEDIFGTGFDIGERRTHLMLEFLTVLASQNQSDPFAVVQSDEWGRFAFLKRRNLILRQILFNNPELGIIAKNNQKHEAKWQQWFEQFSAKLQTVADNPTGKDGDGATPYQPEFLAAWFAQLKQVCHEDFERFVTLVKVLRSWSIDTDKDRQWSTLFLFPFGYDSLFWEIVTSGAFKQNLMCGAGQNVFSMLARTRAQDTSDALGQLLVNRFLVNHNGLNTGAGFLSGSQLTQFPHELEVTESRILSELQQASSCAERLERTNQRLKITVSATRYLPYRDLKRYHLLREDFEALCSLDLTKQELFLALGSLGSLHQICYLLEQEQKVLNLPGESTRSCDLNMVVVANPELKSGVRALSMRRLKENITIFGLARAHYVKAHLRAVVAACAPELFTKPSLSGSEQKLVCNLMRCAFDFNPRVHINLLERTITQPKDKDDPSTECIIVVPDGISYAEIEAMLIDDERDMHIKNLHSTWSSDIGLTTKESAVSYYYSLSDELLYYLVLALVPKGRPIALKDFLQKLYERYHLVIGLNEAGSYAVEDADFIANERQFKLKLTRNHLLISLSDACDYVRNPFGKTGGRES